MKKRVWLSILLIPVFGVLVGLSFGFLAGCLDEPRSYPFFGGCFYSPVQVFGLFFATGRLGEYVTGSIALSAIIMSAVIFAFGREQKKIIPLGGSVFGTAEWASLADIKGSGLLDGNGVFLGKLPDGRYIRHEGPDHYAVIAPTRSGKGAGIVVPTLLSWPHSAVIYDLKSENFRLTAGYRSKFSDVLYFNPSSLNTVKFNPLAEIRKGEFDVRDAQSIANIIVEPDKQSGFDHWTRTSNSLLTAAILHVLYAFPEGERNLSGVAKLLSDPTRSLTETLYAMLETKHIVVNGVEVAHPGVAEAARDVLNKSPDDKSSVVSTVMGYLAIYRDPVLSNALSCSDFSIDDLVNGVRPKSLYFVISPADIDRLRPVIRLVVNLVCRRLTEQLVEKGNKHRLLLMLDEFPALGRLEFFETALGFLAGYGIKAMLICQSLNQLRQTYGEKTSILDNANVQVFFAPNTLETAQYISKTLGDCSVHYRTSSKSSSKTRLFDGSVSENVSVGTRALLTPREVLEFPKDEAIIFCSGRPVRAKKIRYFEDSNFSKRVLPAEMPVARPGQAATSFSGAISVGVVVSKEESKSEDIVC